ncbi:MAG: hypothetical protein JSW27_12160, partial [Phycisphaerales bacterium]
MAIKGRLQTILAVWLFSLAATSVANAQYAGGSGTADDPYQIATAADLILLGETPEDYDKHFILSADIDLDPNLPGGKVFDRAVIAPDIDDGSNTWGNNGFDGVPFGGTVYGYGRTISHLTIAGTNYLGLFGTLGEGAEVRSIRLNAVNVTGQDFVGGLAGANRGGEIIDCYSSGRVRGNRYVGGLVGINWPTIGWQYWYPGGPHAVDDARPASIYLSQAAGEVYGQEFIG